MDSTKKFNQLCVFFMQDISDICPELKDQINTLRLAMNVANTSSYSTTQRMYRSHVCIPYGSYIIEKDDSFIKDVTSDENNALIDIVKQIWSGLDEANKNQIWRYLQNLCKLAHTCG